MGSVTTTNWLLLIILVLIVLGLLGVYRGRL